MGKWSGLGIVVGRFTDPSEFGVSSKISRVCSSTPTRYLECTGRLDLLR